MKCLHCTLFLLAVSSSVEASQIRGVAQDTAKKNYSAEARDLAEAAQLFHRELEQEFNEYDDGAGCSCSKDAVKELSQKHIVAMEKVPYVTMAVLEENKDILYSGTSSYNPLENYIFVTSAVEALVDYARCILLQIDCNLCGVDGSDSSDTTVMPGGGGETIEVTDGGRRQLGDITPYDGISNFQCCCDVKAILKVVVDNINDLYKKAILNPGGDTFITVSINSLFNLAVQAIDMLAETYLNQHNPYVCPTPTIPTSLPVTS